MLLLSGISSLAGFVVVLAHFDVALLDLFGLFPFLSRRLIGFPPQGTRVDFTALGSVLALLQVVLDQVLSL